MLINLVILILSPIVFFFLFKTPLIKKIDTLVLWGVYLIKKIDTLVLWGVYFLYCYCLILVFGINLSFVSENERESLFPIFGIILEHDVTPYILNLFAITGISLFIGTPLARILSKKIHQHTRKTYSNYNNKIQKLMPTESWTKIKKELDTNSSPLISRGLRRLNIYDVIKVEEWRLLSVSVNFTNHISQVLREIGFELGLRLGETNELEKINTLRTQIQKWHYTLSVYNTLSWAVYFIFPAVIALLITIIGDYFKYIPEDIFYFLLGMTLILASYPSIIIFNSLANILTNTLWRENATSEDNFIYRLFIIGLSWALASVLIFSGLHLIINKNGPELKAISATIVELIIPFIEPSEDSLLKDVNASMKLLLSISSISTVAVVLHIVLKFVNLKYEHNFYVDRSSLLTVPPELIRIFAGFLVFIFSTSLIYSAILNYSYNSGSPPGDYPPPPGYYTSPGGYYIPPNIPSPGGYIPSNIVDVQKDIKEKNRPELISFLPYSIFLAIMGALLTVATRDLLENYFAGLSLKVNVPFEENDRIRVGGIGMSEVMEVGLRSTKLYGIENNTYIHIPHKKMAHEVIENFTYPTLDYRRKVVIYVLDTDNTVDTNKNRPRCAPFDSIPGRAEGLLLLCAQLSSGVRLPLVEHITWRPGKLKNKLSQMIFKLGENNQDLVIELKNNLTDNYEDNIWIKIEKIFKKIKSNQPSVSKREKLIGEATTIIYEDCKFIKFLNSGEGIKKDIADLLDEHAQRYVEENSIRLDFEELIYGKSFANGEVSEGETLDKIWELLPKAINLKKLFVHDLISLANKDSNDTNLKETIKKRIRIRIWRIVFETNQINKYLCSNLKAENKKSNWENFGQSEENETESIRVGNIKEFDKKTDETQYDLLHEDCMRNMPRLFRDIVIQFDSITDTDKKPCPLLRKIAEHATCLSFHYFALAELLWRLKDEEDSVAIKRNIDNATMSLLDSPRVLSHQRIVDDIRYWKIELDIVVSLAEQSDEIIHHLNRRIDKFWPCFNLDKK